MFSKGAGFSVSGHLQVISIHPTVNEKTEIHKYIFTYIAKIQSTIVKGGPPSSPTLTRKLIANDHNALILLPVCFTVIIAIPC